MNLCNPDQLRQTWCSNSESNRKVRLAPPDERPVGLVLISLGVTNRSILIGGLPELLSTSVFTAARLRPAIVRYPHSSPAV